MNNVLAENENIAKKTKEKNNAKVYPIWLEQLDKTKEGKIKNTFNNFKIILENDEEFAGNLMFNEFAFRSCYKQKGKITFINDNIVTDILIKIERKYDGINNRKILEQVIDLVTQENSFNPVIEHLNSLKWDGKPRLATALSDYFGCLHSRYNEYCFRVFLNGAIARALHPGIKFDYMLTLYGDQRTR